MVLSHEAEDVCYVSDVIWRHIRFPKCQDFFSLPALVCWDGGNREQSRVMGYKTDRVMSVINFKKSL